MSSEDAELIFPEDNTLPIKDTYIYSCGMVTPSFLYHRRVSVFLFSCIYNAPVTLPQVQVLLISLFLQTKCQQLTCLSSLMLHSLVPQPYEWLLPLFLCHLNTSLHSLDWPYKGPGLTQYSVTNVASLEASCQKLPWEAPCSRQMCAPLCSPFLLRI